VVEALEIIDGHDDFLDVAGDGRPVGRLDEKRDAPRIFVGAVDIDTYALGAFVVPVALGNLWMFNPLAAPPCRPGVDVALVGSALPVSLNGVVCERDVILNEPGRLRAVFGTHRTTHPSAATSVSKQPAA
jgi:hypothetical protein